MGSEADLEHLVTLRLQESADAFRESLRLDPSGPEAWANLGAVLAKLQEWRPAVLAMEQSLHYRKSDWRMWDNLLLAAVRAKDYEKALKAAERIAALRHRDPANPVAPVLPLRRIVGAVLRSLEVSRRREAGEAVAAAASGPLGDDGDDAHGTASLWSADAASAVAMALASEDADTDWADDADDADADASGLGPVLDLFGLPAHRHLSRTRAVIERVAGESGKWEVWEMASDLAESEGDDDAVIEHLRRTVRAMATAFPSWPSGAVSTAVASRAEHITASVGDDESLAVRASKAAELGSGREAAASVMRRVVGVHIRLARRLIQRAKADAPADAPVAFTSDDPSDREAAAVAAELAAAGPSADARRDASSARMLLDGLLGAIDEGRAFRGEPEVEQVSALLAEATSLESGSG